MLTEHSKFLHGLSEPVRCKILDFLASQDGPVTTSLIAISVGVRPSACSHHLVILERDNLVRSIRNGNNVIYGINRLSFAVLASLFTNYGNFEKIGAQNESL